MLHLLYILAFTVIAFLTVSNLIRSLINVSLGSQRSPRSWQRSLPNNYHPELFDEQGEAINEPLLVMRSVNVEDARQKLDAIFHASPSAQRDLEEES
ncbi:MAG: DUF2973 domain-containing protein [Microcystaceae cyanobacterium]|nr:DUF2973 domain-containing protein [Merismopediaceae bacterium]